MSEADVRPLIVAIDGPAGAGKSTVSKTLALRLNYTLVDTGAIYRCVALAVLRRGISFDDAKGLEELVAKIRIQFRIDEEKNHVFLDDENVSELIRSAEISTAASQVSAQRVVRENLLGLQRRLALSAKTGAILEGRDIGTVVFPDADVKVFLFADPQVRAKRRFEERFARGKTDSVGEVLKEQNQRDEEDSNRALAPLKAAPDALRLDSTHMALSDVVNAIENVVLQKLHR